MKSNRLCKIFTTAAGCAALALPAAAMAQPIIHANQNTAATPSTLVVQSGVKTVKGHFKTFTVIDTAQTPTVNGQFTGCVMANGVFKTSSGKTIHFTAEHDYLLPAQAPTLTDKFFLAMVAAPKTALQKLSYKPGLSTTACGNTVSNLATKFSYHGHTYLAP